MALIKCKECGNQVSKKAAKCPQCGAPAKAKGRGCALLLVLIAAVGLLGAMFSEGKKNTVVAKTPFEIRQDKIEQSFSAWNGAHRGLEKAVKESMNDPGSYQHDKTTFLDKGDHLLVKTTFRGRNAFGGMVINSVFAKVDLNGSVLEIISQGN